MELVGTESDHHRFLGRNLPEITVAIIPTLFRDHRQKSKKPNVSSFFRLFTVIPK